MGERGRTLTLSSYKHPGHKEIPELPGTFEDFLACFNLDDWPRVPHLPDLSPSPFVSKLKNDYPLDTITQYLYKNAPMPYEIISRLEKRIDECKVEVQEHAKHIFTLESEKPKTDEQPVQVDVTSSPESQDTSKKKIKIDVKFPAEAPKDPSSKELENIKFSGFRFWRLTKLPNNLEPAHLWDLVLKVQVFKPNQEEQDHFFDRISDSYVTLLWSIPSYIKDAFLQMYPDCLSQAIYISFCEAFPEASHRFNDEFKDELMDLIFLWIRGFKPPKFAWKNWKTPCTEKLKKASVEKDSSSHMKLQPKRKTTSRSQSGSSSRSRSKAKVLRFQVTEDEQLQQPAAEEKESHYAGDGPDFQHSLFNLGGQSPLVSYYLQMHGIPNTLANSRGYRINHSEICKVPPLSPTYTDVIQNSIKSSRKLLSKFADFEHKCAAELVVLEEQREKVNRKFRRMLETITPKPTEKRIKIEQFLLRMANAKIQRHGSDSGAKDV